jgi:fluoroquinolone transport system ATP-binding protein
MISVTNLRFRYDGGSADVISGISFQIRKGEIFGFLGPSGAGKSTTQKILTGQLKTYSGSVIVAGAEIRNADRKLYNLLGVAFEFPNLYEKLTAIENLKLFGSFYDRKLVDPGKLLGLVNLYDDRNSLVGSFSKGMKMRLNFVRSIMHNPELLFLDEPTTGLDPVNARIIKDIIRGLRENGTTVFLTTHNMNDAESLCDELALIDNGKLIVCGTPHDLKLKFGEDKVRVSLRHTDKRITSEYSLKGIGSDKDFLAAIRSGEVETIHSCEASLEDIFIKVTGHGLTGSLTETSDHA